MDIKKNPLDEIEGIGPGRKKALLHAFGSARGVGRASVVDLVQGRRRHLSCVRSSKANSCKRQLC
jgi:excinuclease ABC subunit C